MNIEGDQRIRAIDATAIPYYDTMQYDDDNIQTYTAKKNGATWKSGHILSVVLYGPMLSYLALPVNSWHT